MRVAKDFRFEAAHRIPWHSGACRHLHGHSYHLTVALDGEPDERGMVIDFKHIKALLADLIEAMDHSVIAAEGDEELIRAVESLGSKLFVLPYDSTAENLCRFIARRMLDSAADVLAAHAISQVYVRVAETRTCYAEVALPVGAPAGGDGASGGASAVRSV